PRQDVLQLLLEELLHEGEIVGDARLPVPRAVADALGDLRDRHAAGGEILHQRRVDAGLTLEAVDPFGAAAVEPALDVLDEHARVTPRALDGDGAGRHFDLDRVGLGFRHLGCRRPAGADELPERIRRGLHVKDVGDPGADEALRGLPFLVLPDRLAGHPVDLGIVRRERRGHAADRDGAAREADRDEAPEDVREERRRLDVHAEAVGLRPSRVEERERGAEDRGVHRLAVDGDVGLVEMEPAFAVHEERQLPRREPVAPPALAVLERELAVDRGEAVMRGADRVDEPVAPRILVVVQVARGALAFGPGVERVDEHGRDRARARDLDPGPLEIVGNGRNAPAPARRRAHGRVAGHHVLLERTLEHLVAPLAQLQGARPERVVQADHVLAERRSEKPRGSFDRDELHARRVGGHRRPLSLVSETVSFRMATERCQWQNGGVRFRAFWRSAMATVLFVVKATIRKDREDAFNRWYNEEHVPQVLQFKGLVSARRYRALEGEDTYRYMAVYELQDEATYRRLMASDHMKALRADYDAKFGDVSERARFAYTQVWP